MSFGQSRKNAPRLCAARVCRRAARRLLAGVVSEAVYQYTSGEGVAGMCDQQKVNADPVATLSGYKMVDAGMVCYLPLPPHTHTRPPTTPHSHGLAGAPTGRSDSAARRRRNLR